MSKWFDHLPVPKSQPPSITAEELRGMLSSGPPGRDVIVVDVRRADIEGDAAHVIAGAINLPAQTFHQTLPGICGVLQSISTVVFHCSSSNGRGPRCAAWYQDELDARGCTTSRAVVLAGGIKRWADVYPDMLVSTEAEASVQEKTT